MKTRSERLQARADRLQTRLLACRAKKEREWRKCMKAAALSGKADKEAKRLERRLDATVEALAGELRAAKRRAKAAPPADPPAEALNGR